MQSKRLLPTYDVFDEMRNFAPADHQELFAVGGKPVALTICEDAWNDKHFWDRRLYGVDPVEDLIGAGGKVLLNISASPVLSAQARTAPRHAGDHRARTIACRWRW